MGALSGVGRIIGEGAIGGTRGAGRGMGWIGRDNGGTGRGMG